MPAERQTTTGDTGERIVRYRRKAIPLHWKDRRAEILNRFPEVFWDRCAGDREAMSAYGWIPRDDGRFDFLVVQFQEKPGGDEDWCWLVTSSAKWSQDFAVRIGFRPEQHNDCERIEDFFGGSVRGAIHLG